MQNDNENIKEFKPLERHVKYLEIYLNSEVKLKNIDIYTQANVPENTYYSDFRNKDFVNWYYEEIKKNYNRYRPALVHKVIRKGLSEDGTTEDLKLALQVTETWTPTQKTHNLNESYEDFLKRKEREHNLE